MKFTARILGAIFFVFLLLTLFSKASFAQAYQSPQYLAPSTDANVPQNLHTYTQNVLIETLSAVVCQLSGFDPVTKSNECLGIDFQNQKIGYVKTQGVVNSLGNMIAVLYVPPAHLNDYVSYLSDNFGIAKPTYAQGTGFDSLRPVSGLWVIFRNLSYVLLVFVFLVIGLAIMLRVRIDPRTVMTVQNQIPKIIVALVLITLSFAIAGFLIDIMWISIYLVISLLSSADTSLSAGAITGGLLRTPLDFANTTVNILHTALNAAGAISSVLTCALFGSNLTCGGDIGFDLLTALTSIIYTIFSIIISWIVGIIAFLIILIAVIWALIRLWFALLKAYVFILIDIIFAPLWILAGLLPGTGLGVGAWLRDILGNLAAFPAVVVMFMLAKIFADKFGQETGFVPPLVGNPGVPGALGPLIALGIILATPNVVEMTKKAFKSPNVSGGLGPIGQAIGVGIAYPIRTSKTIGTLAVLSKEKDSTTGKPVGILGAIRKNITRSR